MDVFLLPLILIPFFFFLRWFLFDYVLKPFGRAFSPKNDEKTVHKLAESLSKILYYAPMSIFGIQIVLQNDWFFNTRALWTGFPNPTIEPELPLFYGIQASYYIYLLISHLFLDARRKDFWQMLIHHIVTLILVIFSYKFSYLRVGVLVFFTMDICDVFLEGARSGNYLGWDTISNISFIILLLAWIVLRLLVFPFVIMRSAYYESIQVHDEEGYFEWPRGVYYTFNASLFILLLLQIYWFWLLIRVLIRIIKDGKLTDVTDKQQLKALQAREQQAKAASPKKVKKTD